MYRKFWLENSNPDLLNNKYYFTNKTYFHFLDNPRGLGVRKEISAVRLGESEIVSSERLEIGDIQGDVVFYGKNEGDIYQEYANFIQFLKYKPLKFFYLTPNSTKSKFCKVVFTGIEKTQIGENDCLICPVSFHKTTQWYDKDDTILTFQRETQSDIGKYYNLTRDYHYASASLDDIEINIEGTNDAPFIFEINGVVENPMLILKQNNVQYGIIKLNGTFGYVNINSYDDEQSIYLENTMGASIPNPTSYQDLSVGDGYSYVTWNKLKVGANTVEFNCGNIETFDGTILIKYKNNYATV